MLLSIYQRHCCPDRMLGLHDLLRFRAEGTHQGSLLSLALSFFVRSPERLAFPPDRAAMSSYWDFILPSTHQVIGLSRLFLTIAATDGPCLEFGSWSPAASSS